jgi:F-type H+-transporting ATPase subunit a
MKIEESPYPFTEVADMPGFAFEIGHAKLDLPEPLSKFMILIALAAVLALLLFLPLGRRVTTRGESRSRIWSFGEMLLVFIRDQVARPAIGEHDYRRFLPFLWTIFVFVLFLNLLGMIPFLGSATASLMVTIPLALVAFLVIHYNGIRASHGVGNYIKTFIPPIEMNDPVMKIIGPFLVVGLFFLDILGAFIRGVVLAIRLFANMLAGHTALFVILSFIHQIGLAAANGNDTANTLFWPVTFFSVLIVTALSLLELFVACLQAFIFTFLTATFIGLAMHPEH